MHRLWYAEGLLSYEGDASLRLTDSSAGHIGLYTLDSMGQLKSPFQLIQSIKGVTQW